MTQDQYNAKLLSTLERIAKALEETNKLIKPFSDKVTRDTIGTFRLR